MLSCKVRVPLPLPNPRPERKERETPLKKKPKKKTNQRSVLTALSNLWRPLVVHTILATFPYQPGKPHWTHHLACPGLPTSQKWILCQSRIHGAHDS